MKYIYSHTSLGPAGNENLLLQVGKPEAEIFLKRIAKFWAGADMNPDQDTLYEYVCAYSDYDGPADHEAILKWLDKLGSPEFYDCEVVQTDPFLGYATRLRVSRESALAQLIASGADAKSAEIYVGQHDFIDLTLLTAGVWTYTRDDLDSDTEVDEECDADDLFAPDFASFLARIFQVDVSIFDESKLFYVGA